MSDDFFLLSATFYFNRLGIGLSVDTHSIGKCLFFIGIGAKRHIKDDERKCSTIADSLGMVDHLIHGGRECVFFAKKAHIETVSDQYHLHFTIKQLGKERIIGCDHSNRLFSFELLQGFDGDFFFYFGCLYTHHSTL